MQISTIRTRAITALARAPDLAYRPVMTTVTNCSNVAEAELIKSVLEEANIPASIIDDLFGGAIRVQVEEEHMAEAQRLLQELQAAPQDDGEDQPRG